MPGAQPDAVPTVASIVRRWAAERPHHPALRQDGEEVSWAELDQRADGVAAALHAAGIGAGDRVAYLDRNSIDQVELLVGAIRLGAVPTPVNFRLAPPEVAWIVRDSGAPVFAVGADLRGLLEPVLAELGQVDVLTLGGPGGWRDAAAGPAPDHAPSPGEVALQLYSSGTTGRPKGVLLTHANLAAGLTIYPPMIDLDGSSVSLVPMPMFHIGGVGWLLAGMAVGATSVLVRDVVPSELVALVERERVTHSFLVPAVLQFMLAVPGVGDRDHSSLRYLLYGASPISERVLTAALRTFGCRFAQVYGLTETTGTVSVLLHEDHDPDGPHRQRLRSVGRAAPGSVLRVVDPATGEDAPVGAVGEITVSGPTVMAGYWHLPEATAATIDGDGWLRTGDAGYFDEDGYLYIYDRVKDMIVSGGENVYPAEVENALMSHPAVADVAVIGVPDERWGEVPLALVVRRPGVAVDPQELVGHCRARLAGFKTPRRVEWVDALPRNPSGKILKRELRAPYWQGRDRFVG